jgi:CSLREA domain-containing protein
MNGLHMRHSRSLICVLLAVFLIFSVTGSTSTPVHASTSTFTVNSLADEANAHPGDGLCATSAGECTLRAAVQEANAAAQPTTIILPAGIYTLSIPGTEAVTDAAGDLLITGNLTIQAAGADVTIVQASPTSPPSLPSRCDDCPGRIFRILAGATAEINGLTIRHGHIDLLNDGGAGISNQGSLSLNDSALLDNRGGWQGGALYNSGTATIQRSLIADNGAHFGGAIYNEGLLTIESSTLTGNRAVARGSAIFHAGTTILNNVTIADNPISDGPGITLEQGSGPLHAGNTIIADNGGVNCVGGTLTDLGHNLQFPGTSCGETIPTADPLLLPLAGYGGPTQSIALNLGSPARNAGDNLTCAPTDQRGVVRPLQTACDIGAWEATGINTTWDRALSLTPTGEPLVAATVHDVLVTIGQSRWYKFQVEPGSTVALNLTNLPANYDLTLFGDIQATYDRLTTPQNTADLIQLTAEFAPDAYAPDAYAPDAYASDAYAPDAYAPDAYADDAYAPDAYAPDAYAPDAYAPDAYAPDAYAPDAYAPDAYAPDAYAPDAYAPDAYAPDAYAPDAYAPQLAYTSAQIRSLIAVSALNGTADEFILVNTWDNTGEFYVRVRGRNGIFDPGHAFTLNVEQITGFCSNIQQIPAGAANLQSHAGSGAGYNSIILTDLDRMALTAAEKATLQARLVALAARPEVNGVVVDVHASVAALNQQADLPANTQCPYAKNLVAQAIKEIVDNYRAQNANLEYIVLIGNDDILPFFRHVDRALLANEKNYRPPVRTNTTSYGSLALGYVLSQDAYGADKFLPVGNVDLPLPGLAVGRLVETYDEITNMLDAYEETDGALPQPQSALVTGYDFLVDAADEMTSLYTTGLNNPPITLIAPREFSPLHPDTWTADHLRAELFGSRHDLIFLAGHFSANSALAADYQTRLTTDELVNADVDLRNALVYSPGCHSGYNIVNEHGVVNLTNKLDWAQAFAQKGAVLVAGTGYQYGDTDFLEYSERLYVYFTQQLMADTGAPVPLGTALMNAKRDYLATTAELRGLHEKSLLQITLFGLPMMTLDMPNRLPGSTADPLDVTLQEATTEPGLTLGLQSYDITIPLPSTEVTITLQSVSSDNTLTALYYRGPDGVVANPAEPVLPLTFKDASVSGTVLRGVGFRGGSYTDLANVAPLTGAPTTEIRGVHAPFQSPVFFPINPWRINYFDALTGSGEGAIRLALMGAQFRSNGADVYHGTLRLYESLDLRLYYSNNFIEYGGNIPALAAPPTIDGVMATSNSDNNSVTVQARATGDASAGIQAVWVTYTFCDGQGACGGQWQSLDLTQDALDSARWQGTLPLGSHDPTELRFMLQAVNGVGLVSLATNLGAYYRSDVDPADPSANSLAVAATTLSLSGPASGAYGTQAQFTAVLTAEGQPLAGQPVVFALGAQRRAATTNSSGVATTTIPLLTNAGTNEVRASFAGSSGYRAAAASHSFLITKQTTQVNLTPLNPAIREGDDTGLTATLTDAVGSRLREKLLIFVVSDDSGPRYTLPVITNFVGEASLGSLPLAMGSYDVTVYFGGDVPTLDPANPILSLSDPNYEPSASSAGLTILEPNYPPEVGPITAPLEPVPVNTTITASAVYTDANNDDILTAVWDWGDGSTTTQTLPATSGTASAEHTYTAAGIYTIQLTITDAEGETAVAIFQYLVVFEDETGDGFVTGGGWFWSAAAACYDASVCPEVESKANFGLVVKYKKQGPGGPTGNMQFHVGDFRFQATALTHLLINQGGSQAVIDGSGVLNGQLAPNGTAYQFTVWARDSSPNTFRIQIWYEEGKNKLIVYDNGFHQPLNGGNIKIH